jgi:hypothetical protein
MAGDPMTSSTPFEFDEPLAAAKAAAAAAGGAAGGGGGGGGGGRAGEVATATDVEESEDDDTSVYSHTDVSEGTGAGGLSEADDEEAALLFEGVNAKVFGGGGGGGGGTFRDGNLLDDWLESSVSVAAKMAANLV